MGEIGAYSVVVRSGKLEQYHKKSGNYVQRVQNVGEVGSPCVVADEEDGRGKLVFVATGSKIVHNLSRALDIDASLARFEERSRHVLINDESVCDSCHARLGTKLFAMYPDDTIVCYKCFRRQGESTSVSGRDFKKDALYEPGWLVTG